MKDQNTCYIGVVGGDAEIGICRDSIEGIRLRPGDAGPHFMRATKGFEARQKHIDNWIDNTSHDWILLLDHDQVFAPDTLERLRSHKKTYVSGYYMRRQAKPIASVWFKPWGGEFPIEPWVHPPEKGKLHRLGASGWGCILMHRSVIEDTRVILKGEKEVIEDDMDIWPYDLDKVMGAINALKQLSTLDKPIEPPLLEQAVTTLALEIRPLRGLKNNVGSDIRFPFYALQAGHQLWGDPDVRPGHILSYTLSPNDFDMMPQDSLDKMEAATVKGYTPEREQIRELLAGWAR